jgi:hypothetical protein
VHLTHSRCDSVARNCLAMPSIKVIRYRAIIHRLFVSISVRLVLFFFRFTSAYPRNPAGSCVVQGSQQQQFGRATGRMGIVRSGTPVSRPIENSLQYIYAEVQDKQELKTTSKSEAN